MTPFRIAVMVIVFSAIILLWVLWPRWMPFTTPVDNKGKPEASTELASRGQYGDSFGGLNTLFSGLAFAAFFYTVFLQLSDVKKRDQERHADLVDVRFFRLNDAVRSMTSKFQFKKYEGRRAFIGRVIDIKQQAAIFQNEGKSPSESILSAFNEHFELSRSILEPYYKILELVCETVANSSVKDKDGYANILMAEVHYTEQIMIALRALTPEGARLKELVEKFHLLRNLPDDPRGIETQFFRERFLPCAFGACSTS